VNRAASREAEFLLAAVRRFLNPQSPLPEPAGLDWSGLVRLAAAHSVAPMLRQALRDALLPDEIARELRVAFEANVRWNLNLGAELIRLAELFNNRGIAFVPIKGPLLSQRLHGDPAIRSPGDLDFLIHPGDILRVRDALVAEGYALKSALHWPSDSAYLRCRDGELSFVSEVRNVGVDVHWRVVPAYYASPFDVEDIWSSLVSTRFAGRDLPDLSANHLMLFLCAHGTKHAFERLGWVCDVACCLRAVPDLDWRALLATSARAGTTRQLLTGLRVAAGLLGASLPARLPEDPAVDGLVQIVRQRLLAGVLPVTPTSKLIPFCLRVFESRRHRLRFLAGHLIEPSPAEYQALKLPPALYFLYYPLRPLRLAARRLFHFQSSTAAESPTV
jgi:Uncharacterised nucleotidyltransferase